MEIENIINEVYEEATNAKYPRTTKRDKAIKEIIPFIKGKRIVDLCPQEGELIEQTPAIGVIPNCDIHSFLDNIKPINADLIIVRHVLEHSIMPYVLLRLLKKHTKSVLVVVPENSKNMIIYKNHYSVFDRNGWENLFTKSGWSFTYLGEGVFNGQGNIEYRYLLK